MSNRRIALALAPLLLAACGDHPAVVLQLNNKTVGPIFLSPGGLQYGWASIADAQGVPLLLSASSCASDAPQQGFEIVAPAPAGPQRLDPGSSAELRWDGLIYRARAGSSCYDQVPAPAGRYNVTICWDYQDTNTGGSEQVCALESFELSSTRELVHNVIATPPAPTALSLLNDSASSVWISSFGFDASNPSWVSLRDPAGQPVVQPGACSCICNRACALCARAAVAPQPRAEELLPGQSRLSSFNGIILSMVTTPGGGSCALPVLAPAGTYQARFCWGLGHTGEAAGAGADFLSDVRCEDKGFELGVQTDVVLKLR